MEGYVLTTWSEVEDWIDRNQLEKWTISADRQESGEKATRIVCQTIPEDEMQAKKRYTEACLNASRGLKLYARGYRNTKATNGAFYAEIMIGGERGYMPAQVQQMIGTTQPAVDREELAADIRRQVLNEVAEQRLKEDRARLEEERKEFREQQDSAMGALIHYFGPIGKQLLQNLTGGGTAIAGTQVVGGTVEADRIKPIAEQPEEEPSAFTDDEAAQIEALLTRFKAVEPDYIQLLTRVVEMAEAGDSTYNMARGILMR